jgi:hypothetical protein
MSMTFLIFHYFETSFAGLSLSFFFELAVWAFANQEPLLK